MLSVNGFPLARGSKNVDLKAEVSPHPYKYYMFNIFRACSVNHPKMNLLLYNQVSVNEDSFIIIIDTSLLQPDNPLQSKRFKPHFLIVFTFGSETNF